MSTTRHRGAIRTVYNGIEFRSKLEADWARAFDYLQVEWQYERRGEYYGDTFYLPDFWLPKSRQHVEVKAVFEPEDCQKICALLHHAQPRLHTGELTPDIPIVCARPGGDFFGWLREPARPYGFKFLIENAIRTTLFRCTECRGWWFADDLMGWKCQCCGAYDGDHYVAEELHSPLSIWQAQRPTRNEAEPF